LLLLLLLLLGVNALTLPRKRLHCPVDTDSNSNSNCNSDSYFDSFAKISCCEVYEHHGWLCVLGHYLFSICIATPRAAAAVAAAVDAPSIAAAFQLLNRLPSLPVATKKSAVACTVFVATATATATKRAAQREECVQSKQ